MKLSHLSARRRVLLLCAAVLFAAAVWFFFSYTIVDGSVYPRRGDTIDLRGRDCSLETAAALQERFPGRTVLWDVPLSGGSAPSDSEELELSTLADEDIPLFSCFANLRRVHIASGVPGRTLLALRNACPALKIDASVRLGKTDVPFLAEQLYLSAGTPLPELLEVLPYLPALQKVFFTTGTVSYEMQDALTEALPDIAFQWRMTLLGKTISSAAETVSFAGQPLTDEDVKTLCENLFRLPALETLDVTGCGLTDAQTDALRTASSAVVVYEVELYGKTVSTGAAELDFSNIPIGSGGLDAIESALDKFPRLEKVVMCDCGISNEDMAALNDRHENVRFVWRVYFSGFSLRTDDTNFIAARVRNDFPIYSRDLEVLRYCPDIQALDLGHKDITDLSFLQYVPHLRYLILVENPINDISPIGELKELTYLEMFWTKCEDISPLLGCTALQDLNICYIYCKPDKSLETLTQMPWLERLWYCGNNMTDGQLAELRSALPDTEMYLEQHGESTGGTWRDHPHYYEMRDFFGMYYMPGGTNGVAEDGSQIVIQG